VRHISLSAKIMGRCSQTGGKAFLNTLGVQQEYIVQQERKKFVDNRGIALE